MSTALDIDAIDNERIVEQSKGIVEAEKQCKIALSASAPHPLKLEWNPGGKHGRKTVISVAPGKAVVQPLSKAQAWLGPFMVPNEYKHTADERRREALRNFWASEKSRALNRYDYVRPLSVEKGGYEPIGPHRFPDVTVTIIEADGSEHEPIRLHEMYKIGDWDPLKDSFAPKETPEEVEARYKAELDSRDHEIIELRRQMAEVAGMVKGVIAKGAA